jgi:restriction system protein
VPDYQLDDWVAVLEGRLPQPSPDYLVVTFPDDQIRETYLSTVAERTEKEVRLILRMFLGGSRTIHEFDELHLAGLKARRQAQAPQEHSPDAVSGLDFTEYDRRVILHFSGESSTPTWEGLTWVIDLLPHFPQQAIDAVHAYVLAHAQVLPELRIGGLADAAELIRARYLTHGTATVEALLDVLLSLNSRDFEFLVAHVYREMGYEVVVTPAQKDGGKDVIATRTGEVLYIECKNWRGRVDSEVVAGLTGRVEMHRVTRGIVIGTSGFTQGHASATQVAAESPARISLVSGTELIAQLNEHLGSEWHRRLERLLQAERISQSRDHAAD